MVQKVMLEAAGSANVGGYAKKPGLWEILRAIDWSIPPQLAEELIPSSRAGVAASPSSSIEGAQSDEELAEMAIVQEVSPEGWFSLSSWAKQTSNLKPWERGLAFSLGRLAAAGRPPSRKQATHGARILRESTALGFVHDVQLAPADTAAELEEVTSSQPALTESVGPAPG
jgi:hypothetical protein